MFEKNNRIGLVVYLYYNRDARKLYKFGDAYYHSKKTRYLVLYIDAKDLETKLKEIKKLKFVKEVKPSAFDEIDHNFVGNLHRQEEKEVVIDS
ncbi:YlbG family protein [Streptococcus didelphis]|uniref:UPF0298 protein N1496_03030 n=1 Tax=Streptococcus didelphis TaxID=102886 RepID=A0ABY9LI88_9STRE|nr:YlbG family protein [Streptococcus didelphis]WMB28544.1 YlbG family protein [Streptococcus didelphis]WMB29219.1 YlbG family protein [Streptococcus didelphis]